MGGFHGPGHADGRNSGPPKLPITNGIGPGLGLWQRPMGLGLGAWGLTPSHTLRDKRGGGYLAFFDFAGGTFRFFAQPFV